MAKESLIETFPAPVVLKKILLDNLDGKLSVKAPPYTTELFIRNGRLQMATSSPPRIRLGELLVQSGKIGEKDILTYSRYQERLSSHYRCRLGKLLVQNRLISQRDLYETLQRQSLQIAIDTFSLETGAWMFRPFQPGVGAPADLVFDIPLTRLIIEGAESIQDFTYYRRRFWARTPELLPISEDLGRELGDDYLRFYVKLLQCRKVTADEAQSVMGLEPELFWRRLTVLYLLNLVEFREFHSDAPTAQRMEMLEQLRERLRYRRNDHSELFRLKDTSIISALKDQYFTFSRKTSPGGDTFASDTATQGDAAERHAGYNGALEMLMESTRITILNPAAEVSPGGREKENTAASHPEGGHAYLDLSGTVAPFAVPPPADFPVASPPKSEFAPPSELLSAKAPNPSPMANSSKTFPVTVESNEEPQELYNRASASYRDRKYYEAIRFLEKAIQLDARHSAYFLLLGLSQTHIPNLRPQAEKNLLEAARMEPWNADPLYYLGQLYWMEHLPKKALNYCRKALEVNPGHARAAKLLGRMGAATENKKSLFSLFRK